MFILILQSWQSGFFESCSRIKLRIIHFQKHKVVQQLDLQHFLDEPLIDLFIFEARVAYPLLVLLAARVQQCEVIIKNCFSLVCLYRAVQLQLNAAGKCLFSFVLVKSFSQRPFDIGYDRQHVERIGAREEVSIINGGTAVVYVVVPIGLSGIIDKCF